MDKEWNPTRQDLNRPHSYTTRPEFVNAILPAVRLLERGSGHRPADVPLESSTRRHQMAGVRLHDQPDLATSLQLEGISSGQCEMDFHLDSAIHSHRDDDIALLQREHPSANYIAGTQARRLNCGQQNVAGANPNE